MKFSHLHSCKVCHDGCKEDPRLLRIYLLVADTGVEWMTMFGLQYLGLVVALGVSHIKNIK